MKKILILGANSYIGTSFRKYLTTEYPEQYIVDTGSLRGDAWRRMDWSGYESILNVTGKAHADISSLTEEQKQEYYAVNCDLLLSTVTAATARNQCTLRRRRNRHLRISMGTANGRRNKSYRNCLHRSRRQIPVWQSYVFP